MIIIDAHQDLAWNMLTFGRDYTLSSTEIRWREQGSDIPGFGDDTMLGWLDYQRGNVALVFATLFASPRRYCAGAWDVLCYSDPKQAADLYRQQLDAYARLEQEHNEKFRCLRRQADLHSLLQTWEIQPEFDEETGAMLRGNPVGLVILMESAEAVREPGELEEWWQHGVRIIGPAWVSTPYCGGWKEPGPLTKAGYALLEKMAEFGFGLDLSHMDERALYQALDFFPGVLMASHSNAQALLKDDESNRHLSDRAIRAILERDGVLGVNLYNAYLQPGWRRGDRRDEVSIERVIAMIDYFCQKAGDARHVGIGSDFDGGVGWQSAPMGIDSIADLVKIAPLLLERGYSEEDCAAILGGNWLAVLRRILPETI